MIKKSKPQPRRRKPGGGRTPKYGEKMVQLQARVPPVVKAKLIDEFGSVQTAVDHLIIEPVLSETAHLDAQPDEQREPDITLGIYLVSYGYQLDLKVNGETATFCRDYAGDEPDADAHKKIVIEEISEAFKKVRDRIR